MASVFPDQASAGGLVIRDGAGAPTNPPNVQNAYVPTPAFAITCPPTALPSDCTARIEPRQVNAVVSELIAFAECLDPDGTWDCNSLRNLCAAFKAFITLNLSGTIYTGDDPPPAPEPDKLWWESDTGILYVYYDDGSSQQWVQCTGGGTIAMDGFSIIGNGTQTVPHSVGTVDCGSY